MSRLLTCIAASIGIGLTLLPLFGLIAGALDVDSDPFGVSSSWVETIAQTSMPSLFGRTLLLATVVAIGSLLTGSWLAWIEQRAQFRGGRLLGTLSLLPLALPSYLLAATLQTTLGPAGWIGRIGFPHFDGFWAASAVLILVTTPYVQLVVGAALSRAPFDEEDAARVLGASNFRVFSQVTLPRVRPGIAFSGLLTALYVISDFGAVATLRCPVLTWRLYQAVEMKSFGDAVALGLPLLIATIPLLLATRAIHGRQRSRNFQIANPRSPVRRPISSVAMVLTSAVYLVVIGFGVVVPVASLIGWIVDGVGGAASFVEALPPIWDTIRLAGFGAALTVFLAGAPAWVAARPGLRRSLWIEQAIYMTSAFPGILLAFGLLLLALSGARILATDNAREVYTMLTASGVLLMAGYATRFLAEAFGSLKTALLQLDSRQADNARTLGVSPWKRLFYVQLPAVKPGIAAAFVICALAITKELPATLLLSGPMGLRPLSVRIFDRYEDAFLADAGLSGLLLTTLALTIILMTLKWRRHA
ncbi:MAG: hypothetical protein CMM29_00415 [Rhodospirillaceae bacterium]|nr:hypothetical protein [Rhodospirillaceae bacterium]